MEIPRDLRAVSQSARTLSFIPQPNQTVYPSLPPGLFVFNQDKKTKEVFLMPSQSGHGHPFAANRVNAELGRARDDFSWLGVAGEMLIGYGGVIIGRTPRTGYFHHLLGLTETDDVDHQVPSALTTLDGLPSELYYPVKQWESALTPRVRLELFRPNGAFRQMPAPQLKQAQRDLKLHDPGGYPERIFHLLINIVESIKLLTQFETLEMSRRRTLTSCKSTHFFHTPEVKKAEPTLAPQEQTELII